MAVGRAGSSGTALGDGFRAPAPRPVGAGEGALATMRGLMMTECDELEDSKHTSPN